MCKNCKRLEEQLYMALTERDQAKDQLAQATNLLMQGEALREDMMRKLVLNPEQQKEKLLYILTGERR